MRADQALVDQGLASSRNQAQQMIEEGLVFTTETGSEQPIKKSSQKINDPSALKVLEGNIQRYVSRGGLKLEGAFKRTSLRVEGAMALDVGISTGGFTDCLLKHGASKVIGVDVGHNQLASSLKADPRVVCLEGINARELSAATLVASMGKSGENSIFDIIVVDVSFISLTLILPRLAELLKQNGKVLALVKPQFEVGASNLGKGGVVKDSSLYAGVEEKIRATCADVGLKVEDYFESSIEGGDGNKEFFVYTSRM
jgi:23S rRNA (cytidine1920-2'-O)/16S rRNA (cytidine1409-2'-O)-methyltransferase